MKKPKTVLCVQLFIALLAMAYLPALRQQLSRSLSLFASPVERLRFHSFTVLLLSVPVGAIWVIGSIQARRPGARLNVALLLVLPLIASFRQLPPASALVALADGQLSGEALGAAAVPVTLCLVSALLLLATLFDPLLRQYLSSRPIGTTGANGVPDVPENVMEPGRQEGGDER